MSNINYIYDILSFMYKRSLKNNIKEFNNKNLKRLLVKNNLLSEYIFKNTNTKFDIKIDYIVKLKQKINNLKNSIIICDKLIKNYLIFKTYRGDNFIRVPNDLDIIIPNSQYEICKKKFIKLGFIIKDEILEERSYGLHKKNYLKIHVHTEISWCEKKFVSNKFLFSKTQNVKFHGKRINIPSKEAEFLITLAHSNFEPLHLMISEIVYLYSMMNDININKIYNEAKENNWEKTLSKILGALNDLHYKIYGEKLKKLNNFNSKFEDVFLSYKTPYTYKRLHLIKSVIEVKIFNYVLRKIPKVIEHSLKMNTFNYLNSPEK
jgi:hypothetical protein